MTARQYINASIPVLKPSDTVEDALLYMNDFKTFFLPLVRQSRFEGFQSEDILLNYNNDTLLKDIPPLVCKTLIQDTDPILEIIKKSYAIEASILPVVTEDEDYLGVIEKPTIYQEFIGYLSINHDGALLEVKLKENDNSLSDISRIIEGESARIVSFFITADEVGEIIWSFKLDVANIQSVISSLERFGYEVASYHSTEPINNVEKDRYDMLMKYLSI